MRQTHPLTHPRHKPPQALANLKHRIRKYLKRERRKALPEGFDYWDFDCRFGLTEEAAEVCHVAEIIGKIDEAAALDAPSVYIEILAKPAKRTKRPAPEGAPTED